MAKKKAAAPRREPVVEKDPWDGVESGVTVGALLRQLRGYDPDDLVSFGAHGWLTFHRVKDRGGIAHIEFNELPDVHVVMTKDHPYREYLERTGQWSR